MKFMKISYKVLTQHFVLTKYYSNIKNNPNWDRCFECVYFVDKIVWCLAKFIFSVGNFSLTASRWWSYLSQSSVFQCFIALAFFKSFF